MNDLLTQVLAAHGGLDRWNTFQKVTAAVVSGGGLIPMKCLDDSPTPRDRTVWLHEKVSFIRPFGQPDWHMVFTPIGW